MEPLITATAIGAGGLVLLYSLLTWYRQKESRDLQKVELEVLAAENNGAFSAKDDDRFIKKTMKAHQIRPELPFKVSNIFKKELDNQTTYIFDYNYPQTRVTPEIGIPKNVYRHVALVDLGKPKFSRFKLSQHPLQGEVFSSAGLPLLEESKRPNWIRDSLTVFATRKKTDEIVTLLDENVKLEAILANPNVEEIFFSGQFVGIFYKGQIKAKEKELQRVEEDAALLGKLFGTQLKSGSKKDKGSAEIERLKAEEDNNQSQAGV